MVDRDPEAESRFLRSRSSLLLAREWRLRRKMPAEGSTGHVQPGDNTRRFAFSSLFRSLFSSRSFQPVPTLSHRQTRDALSFFLLVFKVQGVTRGGGEEGARVHKDHMPARLKLQGKRSCSRLSSSDFRSLLNYPPTYFCLRPPHCPLLRRSFECTRSFSKQPESIVVSAPFSCFERICVKIGKKPG